MRNKSVRVITLVILVLLISVSAFAKKGPQPDTIYFDTRMNQDIGLKDTVEGNTDLFLFGLSAPIVNSLSDEELNELDIYKIPSGSWSILLNPYPNEAPYTGVNSEGEEVFNPFAINEIRFALNYLINRQYIVDEILGGGGQPKFNPATPGQPGTYKYQLLVSKMGLTAEGDEEKAIEDITAAMEKAAELPELQGRLVKDGKWWTFDGKPITLKFALRADDPNGRVKEGMYIANQVEKVGFKVDRMVLARQKCYDLAYFGNPADLDWHLYTEGWGAGATRKWWGGTIVQMYASVWGYYPGGGNPDFWNFKNPTVDKLAVNAYNGNVLTEEEYWDAMLTTVELGMKDAVRLQMVDTMDYFVAKKDRFNKRMVYGLGDGLNEWSLITADVKGDVMRVTQYSDKGSLFMSAWDPVGVDGFSDVYSGYIADPCISPTAFGSPVTADFTPYKVELLDHQNKVRKDDEGNLVGEIEVDPEAVKYDPVKDEWVEVGEGLTSYSSSDFSIKWSNFHHGVMMELADIVYAEAFVEEWSTKDNAEDPTYDEQYANYMNSFSDPVGVVFDKENDTFTYYYNYNFPADEMREALWFTPSYKVSATPGIGVTWEVIEALARMVAYGSESGEVYSFSGSKEGTVEVDVLNQQCVADIRAELEKMIEEKHVPVSIKDYITVEKAIERYQATIDFIDQYGHAFISDGPFFLEKFDPNVNYAKMSAFRDETFPYEAGYWYDYFQTTVLDVENIEVPTMAGAGEDIKVTVNVNKTLYPEDDATPADKANVTITLITDEEEIDFKADMVSPGVYEGVISGDATAELTAGSYTIMAVAEQEDAVPSTRSSMTVIY